ncbi:MAG TPA: hypothetical protein VF111_11405 [Thermoanaerobaculia bacterium]
MRQGIIHQMAGRHGIGLIQPIEGGDAYTFDVSRIEGWRGQSARALGLCAGLPVEFLAENGVIRTVRLLPYAA